MMEKPVSRRKFLKTTSAVAAAVTAATKARSASPNERIRAAALGCRNQGGNDARQFLHSGEFEVATLCDCDEAMFDNALKKIKEATDKAPALVKDFRRVLDDKDIDAVIVAVPDHWHGLMTNMALDAGKHVYVEKPASYNIQDGKLMVEAQKKHPNLVVHVGTQQRSGSHFQQAKQFIDEGGLGTIGFCRGWITHNREVLPSVPDTQPPQTMDYEMWVGPAPFQPYNPQKVHYNWHWQREYGTGEMGNWGAHWLDVCRWFTGVDYPTAVSGHGGQFVVHDIKEWPDTQTIVYEFPNLTMLWEHFGNSGFGPVTGLIISPVGWKSPETRAPSSSIVADGSSTPRRASPNDTRGASWTSPTRAVSPRLFTMAVPRIRQSKRATSPPCCAISAIW